MRSKEDHSKNGAQKTVRDIRRATRRHYSAEEKIRIVLQGLRGEESIAELCRKCTSSKHFGQRALRFKRVSGSSGWSF